MTQEECDADQRVASIVALRINHTAVAFAANDGVHAFHFRHHIHFTHCACTILSAVRFGHIAQGAGGGHITYRVARRVAKDIIRDADEGVLLSEHLSVFADDRQTIDIRIDYKTYIRLAGLEQIADLSQVLGKRFGVMREMAVRRAVQFDDILYADSFQDSGNG